MSKENIASSIRFSLNLIGSFLIGHHFAGHVVDAPMWDVVSGSVITLFSIIWGIYTKDTPIEGLESLIRSFLQGLGGVLVSLGVLSTENVTAIIGVAVALFPLIQSFIYKAKNKQIVNYKIRIDPVTGKAVVN